MLARPEFCSCDQRCGLAETRTILVTPGVPGKTQFAVQAQYLIGAFQSVELVICAGAAGSLGYPRSDGGRVRCVGRHPQPLQPEATGAGMEALSG
jgi:hypothetical protein